METKDRSQHNNDQRSKLQQLGSEEQPTTAMSEQRSNRRQRAVGEQTEERWLDSCPIFIYILTTDSLRIIRQLRQLVPSRIVRYFRDVYRTRSIFRSVRTI